MQKFFESLETRSLFSVAPVITGPPPASAVMSTFAVATPIPRVVGTWKGSVNVVGVHSQPVKLVITSQTSTGRFTGVLTTTKNKSIKVAVTGRVKSNGSVSITVGGTHSGGAINGTGSAKLKAAGKAISFTMSFVQGGRAFGGSLILKKL